MSVGSVMQVGGAIRHGPLLSLAPFAHSGMDEDDPQDKTSSSLRDAHKYTIGGFIGDGQLAWRALGPTIEVLDPLTCSRQAAWTFGAILKNTSPRVTCVCGIGVGAITHIVIGVDLGCENPRGMVGVLSLRRSRIIRAFHFRHKVTNVVMVTGGEKVVDPSTLASELRQSQGLVAVATSHALLFLLDLALDLGDDITSDEMSPAPMVDICLQEYQSELKRSEIISSQHHPVLKLTENHNNGKSFRLLGPDESVLHEAPSHAASVTALLYIPQIASLVVGYSFGSFQIINLNLVTIDCASPYEENLPPVFSFAYQEPENDPRSFVYLWVCRSSSAGEKSGGGSSAGGKSSCSLYAMSYEKKEWIESHGLWYQGLASMSPRFDFETLGGIGEKMSALSLPSRIICAMAVVGTTPSSASSSASASASSSSPLLSTVIMDDALSSSGEENEPVPELSLCLFCWEAHVLDRGCVVTKHYIAIFDINQWYQSQMPSRLRLSGHELCPYMSFHTLDKVPTSVGERLLGGAPWKGSWSRHCTRSHCEKVWFPSSLSYEFNLLTSEGLATYRCPSVQQSALTALLRQGPAAVVSPGHAFSACVFAGLLSSTDEGNSSSMVGEREQLLNTALEYHLLSLLIQCVVEFSEGKFSHLGCAPELLLGWAWNKLRLIKTASDSLCIPLFAPPSEVDEGEPLNTQSLALLHQNLTYLSHIKTVVSAIRDNAGEVTTASAGVLEGRVQVASLVQLHLQVLLWFYHCGLLPQCLPEDVVDEKAVPFPAHAIDKLYGKRRQEVRSLNPSLAGTEFLLVDSLTEECGGGLLAEVWEKGEGGVYPPPSLHALLSMYLLPGIPTHTKHRIVQYLFLDLASLLSENYSSVLEELVKFPSSFSLSPSLIKLTQAFWLIDNKDFQAGLSVLLDPLVNPSDITLDQHRRIIKAFLYQGEESHALAYSHLRQPPKCELEDIRMNLSLLLANGRIREAFHYQRHQRVSDNAKDLLGHMFKGCEQLGRLESVVHLPLSPMEEECFIAYLSSSKVPTAKDILLVYYLQQARYKEISSLCGGGGTRNHNASVVNNRRRLNARTALVEGYISHLPDVRAQMIGPTKSRPTRMLYSKPLPLSARIRQSSSVVHTPRSKSSSFRPSSASSPEGFRASLTPYTPFRSKAQRRKAIRCWKEEVGLVKQDSQQERAESLLNESLIVFPKLSVEDAPARGTSSLLMTPPLFNASSRIESPKGGREGGSVLQEEISRIMEDLLRKSMNIPSPSGRGRSGHSQESSSRLNLSADVVSLLKTPPVRRATPSRPTLQDSMSETPQSILKVRKILQQSLTGSESESPFPSFPLQRGSASAKATRDKSLETVASVSEGGLTPKQLRFDLSISRRLSMDQVVEEEEEDLEEDPQEEEEDEQSAALLRPPPSPPSAPSARRSLPQRKRKRSPSPPQQSSKSSAGEVPTPRKPLPRFGSRSPEDKAIGPTIEEVGVGPTPVATNSLTPTKASSTPQSYAKYHSLSEVKDSSRTTLEVCRTYSERVMKTVSTQWSPHVSKGFLKGDTPSPGGEGVHSPASSLLDDSFHSVEDYVAEEVKERSDEEVDEEELKERDEMKVGKEEKRSDENETEGDGERLKEGEAQKDVISYPEPSEPHGEEERRFGSSTPEVLNEIHGDGVPTESDEGSDQPKTPTGAQEDLESSYVLKFSDSEDEEGEVEDQGGSPSSCGAGKEESSSESVSSDQPRSLSRADTVLVGSITPSLVPPMANSVADQNKVRPSVDSSGYFPSDLANIPPLHLTTKEREIVDKMLEGARSFSLKGFNMPLKETSLNKSYIPVLEFSEDESSSGSEGQKEGGGPEDTPKEDEEKEGLKPEEDLPDGGRENGEADVERDLLDEKVATEEHPEGGVPDREQSEDDMPVRRLSTEDIQEDQNAAEENASDRKNQNVESDGYDSDKTVEFDRSHVLPEEPSLDPHQEDLCSPPSEENPVEAVATETAKLSLSPVVEETRSGQTPTEVDNATDDTNVQEPETITPEGAPMDEGDGELETRVATPVEAVPDNNNICKEDFKDGHPDKEPRTPSRLGLRSRTPPRENVKTMSATKVDTPSRGGKKLRTPSRGGKGKKSPSPSTLPDKAPPQESSDPSPELEARLRSPPKEEELVTPSKRGKRIPVTPSAADESATTPSKRSRVASGLDPSAIIDHDSTTPLRRSSRRNSYSTSPSRILSTPSRRRRRTSENSDPATTPSGESAQKKLEMELTELASEPASGVGEQVSEEEEVIKGATEEGKVDPVPGPVEKPAEVVTPSRGRRTPRKSSSGGTPTLRQDTPRRRSRRISGSTEGLTTIEESEDVLETSTATPASSVPSSGTPKKTPSKRSKRKSLAQPIEPSLETIKEDAELSNPLETNNISPLPPSGVVSEEGPVTQSSLVTQEEPALPRSPTPVKQPRRRSVSANQTPSDRTPSVKRAGEVVSSQDLVTDSVPIARRTRRASLSSNASEGSPDRGSSKSLKTSNSAKNEDAVDTLPVSLPSETSYIAISPDADHDEGSNTTSERRRLSHLTMNSVLGADHKLTALDRRRRSSIKVLSTLPNREFNLDEESPAAGGGRRVSRRRRGSSTTDHSVLVIEKSRTNDEVDVLRQRALQEEEEEVFGEEPPSPVPAEGAGKEAATEEQGPSPGPLYDLLEGGEDMTSLKLPRKVARPRMSSYRRGVSTMKVLRVFDGAEVEPNAEAETNPKKKKRKPSGGSRKGSTNDETVLVLSAQDTKGFAFQNPEEVLTNAEVISEVFKELTHQHERMVSDTFVFSPPLTLNENKRKRTKKRKSAK